MLDDFSTGEVYLVESVPLVVELVMHILSFLGGVGAEYHFHVLVEETHGVGADGSVVVPLYFL